MTSTTQNSKASTGEFTEHAKQIAAPEEGFFFPPDLHGEVDVVLDAGEVLLRGGVDLLELPADPLRDDPLLHRAHGVHRSRLGASGERWPLRLGEGEEEQRRERGAERECASLLSWWRRDETKPENSEEEGLEATG